MDVATVSVVYPFTATTVGADKPQGKIIVAHSQRGQRADRNSAIALHCVHGQAGAANQRITDALGTQDTRPEAGDEGDDSERAS